jgi:hypothetical protein
MNVLVGVDADDDVGWVGVAHYEHLQAKFREPDDPTGGQDCDGMGVPQAPMKPRSADRQVLLGEPTSQRNDTGSIVSWDQALRAAP